MRTRNLTAAATTADVALKPAIPRGQRARPEPGAKENVLREAGENSPAKTRSTRSRATKQDKENVGAMANQPTPKETPAATRKRTRGGKNVPEAVPGPALKKVKTATETAVPPTRSTRNTEKPEEQLKQPPPVQKRATRKTATSESEGIPQAPVMVQSEEGQQQPPNTASGRTRRGKQQLEEEKGIEENAQKDKKIIDKEIEKEMKPANTRTTRRRKVSASESEHVVVAGTASTQEKKEDKKQKQQSVAAPTPIEESPVKAAMRSPVKQSSTPPKPSTKTNVSSLLPAKETSKQPTTTAITTSTPVITKPPLSKPTPVQSEAVPIQRSPIYLTNLNQSPQSTTTTHSAPATSVNKPSPIADDPFALAPMPVKKAKKKTPATKAPAKKALPAPAPPRTAPVTIAEDDVYGMDFNDSSEPQAKQATKRKAKATAKPRQPRAKKPVEPSALRLWDEKELMQKQRQIKINVLHKDFKPKEKPIPPPPQYRPAAAMQLNSTGKNQSSAPPPQIHIPDIEIEPQEVGRQPPQQQKKVETINTSASANGSRLMPWRYSTIRNVSIGNVTMSSLNDSNAENVHPGGQSAKNAAYATVNSRPLHTLQPQRSPMKELNPNETILVPRPPQQHRQKSPVKRVFDVENNFGFDDSDDENDAENLEAKRSKINDKIDSLKKFRHSLNASHISSPIAGPMRPKVTTRVVPPRQVTAIKNQLFTSTPQQVKIRDAFRASTPLAGSSKQKEMAEAAEGERAPLAGEEPQLKLFESLTFEAPAKRNYSSMVPRRKKKVDFYGFSDDEDDVSEDEKSQADESLEPPRAKQAKKSKVQQVQEEKLAKFVDEFNSMCEEVDQYELVIE